MQAGDLVFIMGDPSRPIIGMHPAGGPTHRAEAIKHGTPAVVLELDNDSASERVHIKVLVQGMTLWVPVRSVKASNEEG
jgi:hypothetical protein